MKTWRISGEVERQRVSEGIGDAKVRRTVKREVFVLTVLGNDGQRAHFTQRAPFEMVVGEVVNVKIEHGLQRTLDDDDEGPKKKGR